MSKDERVDAEPTPDRGARSVDARHATGVHIGDGGTVNVTVYNYRGASPQRPTPTPLIDAGGRVKYPYRGLGWYNEHDAPLFFGRDPQIAKVLAQLSGALTAPRIVAVTGVSGAGKSSLVRAGVLPRIRGGALDGAKGVDRWPPFVVFSPGATPLNDLADATARAVGFDAATLRHALREDPTGYAATAAQAAADPNALEGEGGDRRLLVVVDQFERIFTQCEDHSAREQFVTALHTAATTPRTETGTAAAVIVVVVRADFESRCAEFDGLAEAIEQHCMLISMIERQLRLAITEPAKRAGARVEDELTEQLLREIRSARRVPGAVAGPVAVSGAGVLPLISDALDRAWRARADEENLTAADYDRVGGIDRAVADAAQSVYETLTPAQQVVARAVFTRLTVASPDGTDTADRARRADLVDTASTPGDVEAVLEAFAAQRLLTLGDDTVEVSHEVLLSTWPLLRDEWLAQTRVDRAVRARLNAAAQAWDEHNRDPAHLYTGSVRENATATAVRVASELGRHVPLTEVEQLFLATSGRADRRRALQRRAVSAVLLGLVVVLTFVAVVAVRQTRESDRQRRIAVSRDLISRSQLLADTDPYASRLTALTAWRLHKSPETRHAMLEAISNPLTAVLPGHLVTFSPDGRILATSHRDGSVKLWDAVNHQHVGRQLTATQVDVAPYQFSALHAVTFSPDGRLLATASSLDRTVRLWDTATGAQIGERFGFAADPGAMSFSADSRVLAIISSLDKWSFDSRDDVVRFYDVATHQQIGQPLTDHRYPSSLAFSPDGRTLATASRNGTVRLWDSATREPIGEPLAGHTAPITAMAFSPDGRSLATGDQAKGHIAISGGEPSDWLQDRFGTPIVTPRGTTSPPTTRHYDNLRLWDLATGQQIGQPLTGHTEEISSAAFSPDGRTLATASRDRTVRLWDTATHEQVGEPISSVDTSHFTSVTFSPDGQTLATASTDGLVRLRSIAARRLTGVQVAGHVDLVSSVAFSPDGRLLATASRDRTVRLWDTTTHEPAGEPLIGHADEVTMVAFSPDGRLLATGSQDRTVRLWDTTTHEQIGQPLAHTGPVYAVAFSSDRQTLVTVGEEISEGPGHIWLWDTKTHQQTAAIVRKNSVPITAIALSPDGRILATATNVFGVVDLWDTTTRLPIGSSFGTRTMAIAFSPDGRLIATGSEDHTVRLWDSATFEQVGESLTGHTDIVYSVVFSGDGQLMATGSEDRTIRLWDLGTRQLIGKPLAGHTDPIVAMAFSPDSHTLASSGNYNAIYLREVGDVTDVVAALCDWEANTFNSPRWPDDLSVDLRPRLCQ